MDPSAVVITGDLTDSKGADRFSSRLYKEEWITYDRVIRGKACSDLNIFDIKVGVEPKKEDLLRVVRFINLQSCRAIMTLLIFLMMISQNDYFKHTLREVGSIPGTANNKLFTELCERVGPGLRESRLLTPSRRGGASSRNLGRPPFLPNGS